MQSLAQKGVQLRGPRSRPSSVEGLARGVRRSVRPGRPALRTVASETPNVGRDAATPARFGHDFSRIPIRPPSLANRTLAGHPRPATIDELGQAALAATADAGSGERLPAYVKAAMEARFGFDLSRIRVHHASQAAVQVGAKALTRGDHIWFRPGRGPTDLRLLGHEVAHVVQQATGVTGIGGPTGMGREPLEEAARRHSDVVAHEHRGPIYPLPAQAGPALVQFDFDDDVLALLHRMPSADAEDLAPPERRRRIAALSERRERLRQLFQDLPPKEAISVRERLRTRNAGDLLSERFYDILSTATRTELVDILEGAFSIGPTVGRILGGAGFCQPFTKEELDDLDDFAVDRAMNDFVDDYIRIMHGDETADLWNEYLSRSPGDSLVPHVFNDPSSQIVRAFVRHSDTARRQRQIVDAIERNLAGKCPRLTPGVWTDVDVTALLPASELNAGFSFGSPGTTIPGLIAGGMSGSAAGMDSRSVGGQVQLTRINGPSGRSIVRLRTQLRFTVRDAIDFCPGGMGGALARFVTVPMSRLEASGFAFDVPFEVHYDGPPTEVDLGGIAAMFCS